MPFSLKVALDVFQTKRDHTFEGCKGVVGIADERGARPQHARNSFIKVICPGSVCLKSVLRSRQSGSNFSSPLANFKIKTWWTVAQLSALKPVNFAVWLSYGQFCLHIIRIVFERAWGLCVTWFSCSSTSWLAEPTMTFYWCCGQPPSTLFGSVVFQMTMMFPFALVFVVLTN